MLKRSRLVTAVNLYDINFDKTLMISFNSQAAKLRGHAINFQIDVFLMFRSSVTIHGPRNAAVQWLVACCFEDP